VHDTEPSPKRQLNAAGRPLLGANVVEALIPVPEITNDSPPHPEKSVLLIPVIFGAPATTVAVNDLETAVLAVQALSEEPTPTLVNVAVLETTFEPVLPTFGFVTVIA